MGGGEAPLAQLEVGHATLALHHLECVEEVAGAGGLLLRHLLAHLHQALHHVIFERLEVGARDGNQSGAVWQFGLEGAQGVLQSVLACATGSALHHAGQRAGPRHLDACPAIVAVGHGHRQIFIEKTDGLEGIHVAHRIVRVADVPFGGVEKGVKALIGRQSGRHAHHQVGVDNGHGGEDLWATEAHLLACLLVGNHSPKVNLGAGAGCCRDSHDGQGALYALAAAGAAVHIVPEVAAHRRGDSDRLGGVNRTAAAQAHDEVAALGAAHLGALHHGGPDGVGLHTVKHDAVGAALRQQGAHAVQIAQASHRAAGTDNNQCLLARQTGTRQLVQFPGAEEQARGDIQSEFHLSSHNG